jgi:hypothetical protein
VSRSAAHGSAAVGASRLPIPTPQAQALATPARGYVTVEVPDTLSATDATEAWTGTPTIFAVIAAHTGPTCRADRYRVQLATIPNDSTGCVPASAVRLFEVDSRIVVDLGRRRVRAYRDGRKVLDATVTVVASQPPSAVGRFYVDERFVLRSAEGPFGPALGISGTFGCFTRLGTGRPDRISWNRSSGTTWSCCFARLHSSCQRPHETAVCPDAGGNPGHHPPLLRLDVIQSGNRTPAHRHEPRGSRTGLSMARPFRPSQIQSGRVALERGPTPSCRTDSL